MKPKIIHQQAMDFSFKAKQALEQGEFTIAFDLYQQAAELESQVAEFYFDKPDLEPTRSIVIRSAAYMNIKAGQIEKAKKFIFFGLLNITDPLIKSQLNNALELAVSLGNMPPDGASREYNYINLLRQRSVHYVIEPASSAFGHSVSLESIKDFSEGYLKSLKAFAASKFRKVLSLENEIKESFYKDIEKVINPLVTSSAYGSFKFSIANDFLSREGEQKEVSELKANVVSKFHNEIFINPLSDADIAAIKSNYSDEEVNEIFKPLSKIKANTAPYRVAYYDSEDFNKKFVNRIVNNQKSKLLTLKQVSQEDIGELESSIIHKRNSEGGKVHKTTIQKNMLKKYEFDEKLNQISLQNTAPLILSEGIVLNVSFNSEKGFTISFDDFKIENTGIEYEKTLKDFQILFYDKVKYLANSKQKNEEEQKDWEVINKFIGNPDALN
jgi:hypothetical protein